MTILRPERVWFSCLCLTMVSDANSSSLILPRPLRSRRLGQFCWLWCHCWRPFHGSAAQVTSLAAVPVLSSLTSVSDLASKSSSLGSGGPDFDSKCNAPVVASIQIRVVISSTWNLKGDLFGQTFVI